MKSINPATMETIAEYPDMTDDQVKDVIEKCHHEFQSWKNQSFEQRAEKMMNLSKVLLNDQKELSELMTKEMGKPISQSIAEIQKCAKLCEYYSVNAKSFLQDEKIESEFSKSFISYQPIGVILAVMPWNFPFWQVMRFAAPSLMAGNVGVLKHASNVSGCALAIENCFIKAGFPPYAFKTLLISSKQVKAVIENPFVKAVTLTGSTPAGKSVAENAGKNLKKTVLELGGSDAYVVLDDADLDVAAKNCVESRMINSGQSCIAAKRFIVTQKNQEAFTEKVIRLMQNYQMADPLKPETNLGSLARVDLRDELHQQVLSSIKSGAKCLMGGEIPSMKGAFYPPTVLAQVKKGMKAYEEELFGPVATIICAKNDEEALVIANDTEFGLGACVFTQDLKKGEEIAAQKLDAGCCFVNLFVRSHQVLPFGGTKQSGYGRELSYLGIREFVNIKSVVVN